jgi:16S rRNA (guanine527-N7)-methyltransferase
VHSRPCALNFGSFGERMTGESLESHVFNQFHFDSETINRLSEFVEVLASWNQHIRLSGYREKADIRQHLVTEPLLAAHYFGLASSLCSIVDFGSGNGSPGIIFSILYPHLRISLVERKQKKLSFLSYVISRLNLQNTTFYDNIRSALTAQQAPSSTEIWMKAVSMQSLFSELSRPENKGKSFHIKKFGEWDPVPGCQYIRKHVITSEAWSLSPIFKITVSEGLLTV